MTDDPIREELAALIRKEQSLAYTEDMTVLEDGEALYAVALSLLREKREREIPCKWKAGHLRWYSECGHTSTCSFEGPTSKWAKFCPGCGHPVMIAPPKEEPHDR